MRTLAKVNLNKIMWEEEGHQPGARRLSCKKWPSIQRVQSDGQRDAQEQHSPTSLVEDHDWTRSPSPWLPLTIIKPKERPETAKQKACHEATLAETTKQVNTMISEYFDLHSLSTEPKRVSNMTNASEVYSAYIQLQTEPANIQLQTEHIDEQLIHTTSANGQIDRSFRSILSKHPIGNRACRQATYSHNFRQQANWASRQACQKENWTRQKAKWACRR